MILCRADRVADVFFNSFDESTILFLFSNEDTPSKNKIQIRMSEKLHRRLECGKSGIVNATGKEMEKVFSFFKKIKNDEWFCILPEGLLNGKNIYDRQKIAAREQGWLKYKNLGYSDDYIETSMDYLRKTAEKYLDNLNEKYEILSFSKKNAKEWFGEKNKDKRVCRFCGRRKPEVTFKDKAHAIPLALGNRIFFNNYECDECNHFFGNELEPHITKFLGVPIVISGVKGRNGVPPFKFDNGIVTHNKGNSWMEVIYKNDNLNSISDKKGNNLIDFGKGELYIPVRVYKELVKIALSFVPEDKIQLFNNTIRWIMNGKDYSDKNLPKVACCFYPQEFNQQPEIVLYLRRNTSAEENPAAVASVLMCGMRFLYIIPFVLNETIDFTIEDNYNEYWNIFSLYSKSTCKWQHVDLSSGKSIISHLQLNFNIEDDCFGENRRETKC